ncbi:hypothetical protein JCM33374_g4845 [Metschnikowia sp. JCM 33374]|nr:hypothetical protein JCM33374_g4845 [Metschnikowia sp. JCM 33374]
MKINVPLVSNKAKAVRQKLEILTKPALQTELAAINNVLPKAYWTVSTTANTSQLEASYTLKNYVKTWSFLNLVAANAHSLKHHPKITTTYNQVHISLTTHDVGNQVTHLDTKLATAIHNEYASKFAETTPLVSISESKFTMNRAFQIIDELTKRE